MDSISKRVSNTVNIPSECLSVTPPIPKSIKIEITSHCDLKCFFCQVAITERAKGYIEDQLLYRILDEAKAAGVQEVGLFWLGEPFINRSLADYVRYAKKIGFERVFITTNGRLANEKRLKPIFDSGLDSIKFSLNASSKETFKSTTGVDAYDQVLENIRTASRLRGASKKPMIYSSSVFDPRKPKDYEEIDRQISPFVDEHYPLRLYGDYTLDSSRLEVVRGHENNRTLLDMLPCWSLFTIPHISYDGFMSACFCDFDPKFFMADLKEMSFVEAWHSKKFQELRLAHLEKNVENMPCQGCTAYKS